MTDSFAAPPANSTFPPPPTVPKSDETLGSLSLLVQLSLLGIAFVAGHILQRRKFYYVSTASAALMLGLFFGIAANISNTEERFKKWLNFKEEFFLLFLLPPIIFESGFSLEPKPFFSNFAAICVFAILGTFLATFVTGVLVFVGGFLHLTYKLSLLESFVFGTLISATDPVAVLAIFQDIGGDTNLYALVFGESVLNDAVAIVTYRTLLSYKAVPLAHNGLWESTRLFSFIFIGSILVGALVALTCALLFKYAGLKVTSLHNLECCLFVMFPYAAYMIAESSTLSGIVSSLFCGILMKHYTFPNLSDHARIISEGFFKIIASMAETFVFIYMGVAITIEQQSWRHVGLIFFSLIFIFIARAANVFPCAYLINLFRPAAKQIPDSHQKALWYSGLRGPIAFALALQCVHDLPNEAHGRAIFTTTTAIVVVTVLFVGGGTSSVLERLGLTGPGLPSMRDEVRPLEEELLRAYKNARGSTRLPTTDEDQPLRLESPRSTGDEDGQITPPTTITYRLRQMQTNTPSFTSIDKKYIRPFFTGSKSDDDSDDELEDGAEVGLLQPQPGQGSPRRKVLSSSGGSSGSLSSAAQTTTPPRWPSGSGSVGDGRQKRPPNSGSSSGRGNGTGNH